MPKGDSTKRENFTKRATGNSARDIGRVAEINTTTNLLAQSVRNASGATVLPTVHEAALL